MSSRNRRLLLLVVAAYGLATALLRRRGYRLGGNVVVRCRQGHLFTTIWIPGGSLKAIRLGLWRIQWCPVGRHVDLVRLVKPADLSASEREFAASHHDIPVP